MNQMISTAVATRADSPTRLEHLVGDVEDFFARHWARAPIVYRAPRNLTGLICEEDMWSELDCGLLSRPYFTVFNEGVRTAIGDMTEKREVAGHEIEGFAKAERIRRDFAAGGTFKLNQAEHWHAPIRALVAGMQPHFRGGLEAFVFLSPPGKTAMQAHTDGAHVFILQVAGVKDWVIGKLDGASHSDSTLHQGPIDPALRIELTLHPGDVLYMPHGCPHYASSKDVNSIHVAITIEEPTGLDLAKVCLARFLADSRFLRLDVTHHTMPPAAKVDLLRAALGAFLAGADPAALLDAAIALRRQHR
jgi:hypothetical protein